MIAKRNVPDQVIKQTNGPLLLNLSEKQYLSFADLVFRKPFISFAKHMKRASVSKLSVGTVKGIVWGCPEVQLNRIRGHGKNVSYFQKVITQTFNSKDQRTV